MTEVENVHFLHPLPKRFSLPLSRIGANSKFTVSQQAVVIPTRHAPRALNIAVRNLPDTDSVEFQIPVQRPSSLPASLVWLHNRPPGNGHANFRHEADGFTHGGCLFAAAFQVVISRACKGYLARFPFLT
jgi:hypothetical protein